MDPKQLIFKKLLRGCEKKVLDTEFKFVFARKVRRAHGTARPCATDCSVTVYSTHTRRTTVF